MSPNTPNPRTCNYGWPRWMPGSEFPLMMWGNTGDTVGYLAGIMRCVQGFQLRSQSLNWPFVYDSTMVYQVRQFQTWWNQWGAGLTVDGRAGPQTMPYYKMTAGHAPWN